MIKFLVSLTEAGGVADANGRGWTRVARDRFATPEKDDVRVVWRLSQMPAIPGGALLVRGGDFPADPLERGEDGVYRWPDAAAFAEFVSAGYGEWE